MKLETIDEEFANELSDLCFSHLTKERGAKIITTFSKKQMESMNFS